MSLSVIAQSSCFPILFALGIVALIRRSANPWIVVSGFLSGMLGAYSANESMLRFLPNVGPSDKAEVATASQAWLSAFVEAAIPEELAKGGWMLVFLLGWRRYSAGHGALVGGLVGLGFALHENLAYSKTVPEWRVLGALSHAEWGIILGGILGQALTRSSGRFVAVAGAFAAAILLHGLLDASVFLVDAYESKNGIHLNHTEWEKLPGPGLWLPMLMTGVVEIVSLAWAIVWVRRVRRGRVGEWVSG